MPRIYDICVHVGPGAGDWGSEWARVTVALSAGEARRAFEREQAAGRWVRMFGGADLGRLLRDSHPDDK